MTRTPCPSGKRGSYATWSEGVGAAVRVSRVLGPVRLYACPDCGRWHLTRLPRWVAR